MTRHSYSLALICPVAFVDDGNRLACALGFAGFDYDADKPLAQTLVAPLIASNSEATMPTHYGAHSRADPGFIATIKAATAGELPGASWSRYGLTPERVASLMSAITIEYVEAPGSASWPVAMKSAGVERYAPAPPEIDDE